MARRSTAVVPLILVKRRAPDSPFLGWGTYQRRIPTAFATSPKLVKYRACIQREMKDKKFANLKEVQEAFKSAAAKCKSEVAGEKTIKKKKGVPVIFP